MMTTTYIAASLQSIEDQFNQKLVSLLDSKKRLLMEFEKQQADYKQQLAEITVNLENVLQLIKSFEALEDAGAKLLQKQANGVPFQGERKQEMKDTQQVESDQQSQSAQPVQDQEDDQETEDEQDDEQKQPVEPRKKRRRLHSTSHSLSFHFQNKPRMKPVFDEIRSFSQSCGALFVNICQPYISFRRTRDNVAFLWIVPCQSFLHVYFLSQHIGFPGGTSKVVNPKNHNGDGDIDFVVRSSEEVEIIKPWIQRAIA